MPIVRADSVQSIDSDHGSMNRVARADFRVGAEDRVGSIHYLSGNRQHLLEQFSHSEIQAPSLPEPPDTPISVQYFLQGLSIDGSLLLAVCNLGQEPHCRALVRVL
jgi:hypothetical protein